MANNALKIRYLRKMGVDVWARRHLPQLATLPPSHAETVATEAAAVSSSPSADHREQDWEQLKEQVRDCHACKLCERRTQTVFGVGDENADWMIIGEAPGADEDRQGEPFVGRAGQLLTLMLKALGFERKVVYITNVVKCRPPNNRDPAPEEADACEAYLKQQIELVKPGIILVVGRIAAQRLLRTADTVGAMRGRRFEYNGIPLVVTYHPAYLLRSPKEKHKSWSDLKFAVSVYRGG